MESSSSTSKTITSSQTDLEYSKTAAVEASLEIKAFFIDEAFRELDSTPDREGELPHKMIEVCLEKYAGKNTVAIEQNLMQQVRSGQNMVAEFVVSSNLQSAEIEQRKIVENVDRLPKNVAELRLSCVDELLENTTEIEEKDKLETFRDTVLKQLALPFTERIKLASILMEENKLAEAESTLKEATRIKLNPEVESEETNRLRKFAYTKAFELELSRLMPTFVSSNFGRIDTNNNNFLSQSELTKELSSRQYSGVEKGILQFIIQNFDSIKTSVNDQYFFERAISRSDVNSYFSNTRPFEFR